MDVRDGALFEVRFHPVRNDTLVTMTPAASLAKYEGMWFSEELDAIWRLELRGEDLLLRRSGQRDVSV